MRWVRWWSLWFLLQIHEGTTTVTSDESVYRQRVRVLDHARAIGNVAAKYGLDALRPKTKRLPAVPNATPTHIIEVLLTLAITLPMVWVAAINVSHAPLRSLRLRPG